MIEHFGLDVVQAYMRHVQDNAEEAVRRVIDALDDGALPLRDGLRRRDRGADHRRPPQRAARRSTSPAPRRSSTRTSTHRRRWRRPPCSTCSARSSPTTSRSTTAACVRCASSSRTGSMLAPVYPAAVVAGNVETSQAITGALYAALGVQAEGSGTMNNVTFGNERHQYYETVASGSGAGDGFDGRVRGADPHDQLAADRSRRCSSGASRCWSSEFAIRRGSGGAGRWRGGDGGDPPDLRFREPMTVSTLSGHRRVAPYGMAGGSPGAARPQPRRTRRRHRRRDGRLRLGRRAARRRARDRDTRRRRLRRALTG